MKKIGGWLSIVVIIGFIVLILILSKFRERFTGNSIPTLDDVKSASGNFANGQFTPTGTPSPTMINIANWFKSNAPWPTTTTVNDIIGIVSFPLGIAYGDVFKGNIQPFINFIQSMPSGGSVSDTVTKIVNFVNTTYSPSQPINADTYIRFISIGQPPSPKTNDDINLYYWTYVYLFGQPGSTPTPTPTIPSLPPAPSPAPTPTSSCTPFTRNVPGGTLEVKCF